MLVIDNILRAEELLDGIEAAIFDLDDTLYSEKDYVRSGYKKIAGHFPTVEDMQDKLWQSFLRGEPAIDAVLEREGLSDKKQEALDIYRRQIPEISLYAGVSQMLGRIRQCRKLGIITDGRPEGQRAKLMALGLEADEIIITDELGGIEFRKPNEAAFRLMQSRLDTPFEKMAYIGDNINKDFVAPEKLGMRCIYFKNPDGLYHKN